ncbi:transcription antitermination factor NusB [Anoxybacter fermentans]|uniref:Transcription antitermination protein NusB n=1 Tax=Anoxybacter fermentans TaxID=1323375 RepID=A0A3S9T2Z9_9FIRM|nr:transcription antitermination factor NusB [Anoxybacter fermentans]
MARRQQRIWVLQALFEANFRNLDASQTLANLIEREPDAAKADYTQKLIPLVIENLEEIDSKIEQFSKDWRIDRMAKVDLCILRMAIAEMLYIDDVADSVAINEALEIAKEYSTEKSAKFINGILGAFSKSLEEKQEEIK